MNNYKLIGLFIESQDEFLKVLAKETGKNFLNPEDLLPYFPFTKDDVMDYIKRNKLQKKLLGTVDFTVDSVSREPSMHDGTYLVQDGEKFTFYNQERGAQAERKTFDSMDEAITFVENKKNSDTENANALKKYVDTLFQTYLS